MDSNDDGDDADGDCAVRDDLNANDADADDRRLWTINDSCCYLGSNYLLLLLLLLLLSSLPSPLFDYSDMD